MENINKKTIYRVMKVQHFQLIARLIADETVSQQKL